MNVTTTFCSMIQFYHLNSISQKESEQNQQQKCENQKLWHNWSTWKSAIIATSIRIDYNNPPPHSKQLLVWTCFWGAVGYYVNSNSDLLHMVHQGAGDPLFHWLHYQHILEWLTIVDLLACLVQRTASNLPVAGSCCPTSGNLICFTADCLFGIIWMKSL